MSRHTCLEHHQSHSFGYWIFRISFDPSEKLFNQRVAWIDFQSLFLGQIVTEIGNEPVIQFTKKTR